MDQFFNYDVAARIYDTISKMDADEAEMFTRFFVYEVHKQDIEDNRRTVMRHAEDIQKSLVRDLPDDLRELISKDDGTNYFDKYGREQPRGGSGRWVKIEIPGAKISYGREKNKSTRAVKVDRKKGYQKGGDIDITGALNRAGENTSAFADRWNSYSDNDASTNERTYRRVAAGARLLGTLPSDQAKLASAAGQFAGQFGPEAERVIGPAARRTAYRYRGTERMPDAELGKIRREALVTQRKTVFSQKEIDERKPLTPEQRMDASEKAAQAYLKNRLPKKNLAELQRQSGKLPPSEGVIISPTGEIVTQAVGYNEDHYLPFNLKNLKGLKGGSYVRTRSQGGLTSEDIYTGLLSGARSVTVVSRSGTFTLDFEDDLRGGRRYSDKARQMVGRYAQTLDAVESKKVTRRKLDPNERAEIRQEVENEMGGMGYKQSEIEAAIGRREEEYRKNPQLTNEELKQVNEAAKKAADEWTGHRGTFGSERIPTDPEKRYAFFRSAYMDRAMEGKKSRNYQLDADGYNAAMEALQEQFPYFIKETRFRPWDDREMVDRGADTGYVRPRYNRPKGVQAGYFDEEITGRGKFNASELHYQNDGVRNRNRAAQAGESEEQAVEEGKQAVKRVPLGEAQEVSRAKGLYKTQAKKMAETAWPLVGERNRDTYQAITAFRDKNWDLDKLSDADIKAVVADIDRLMDQARNASLNDSHRNAVRLVETMRKDLRSAEAAVKSRAVFDRNKWTPGEVEEIPWRYNETKEHTIGTKADYKTAFDTVKQRARIDLPDNVSDRDLLEREKQHARVYKTAKALGEKPDDYDVQTDFLDAMRLAGFSDGQREGARDRIIAGDLGGMKQLMDEQANKQEAIVQLRSILRAAGGNLTEAPKQVQSGTLKGEVVRQGVEEKKKADPMDALQAMMKNGDEQTRTSAKEVFNAFHHGNDDQLKAAIKALPQEHKWVGELIDEIRRD